MPPANETSIKETPCANRRILYLISDYPRWSETFIRQDLKLLLAQGVPIMPVALFSGDCPMESDWPQVRILTHPAAPDESETASRARTWLASLRPWVAALIPRFLKAHYTLFKHRALIRQLLQLCRDHQVTHIHAEFAGIAALLGSEVSRLHGSTLSIGLHAQDVHRLKYPPSRLFGRASLLLACNQAAAQALLQKCPWLTPRLQILPHGLDLESWPYHEARQPTRGLNLLFVGRLVPKKGVPLLLQALQELLHSHPQPTTLTIVGTGPQEPALRALAQKLGVASQVTWKGRLTQRELKPLYAQASCLVVPSILAPDGDQDGIPNAMVEAMATGLPVVATLAGSLAELLTEETGWPIKNSAPAPLAKAIMECTTQPEEANRRRHHARQLLESHFDAKKLAEKRAYFLLNVKPSGELSVK